MATNKYTSVIRPENHQLHGLGDFRYLYQRELKKLTISVDRCILRTVFGDEAKRIYYKSAGLNEEKDPYFKAVVNASAVAWNRDFEFIKMDTRVREVVEERQIVMWWLKNNTSHSDRIIGLFCGDKDHATVIHASKVVRKLLNNDKPFTVKIEDFLRAIKTELNSD